MLIILIAGTFFAAIKPSKLYWPMLPVIGLFVIMASRGRPGSDAYLLPIFVPTCLITACFLGKIKSKTLMWIIVAVAITPSLALTLAYDTIAAGENARFTATKWINQNIPSGASISRSQYPVSYRTAMTNPDIYPQYSLWMQPEKAKVSDYFIDCSYQWEGPSWDKRFAKNYQPSIPPSDEFVEIKRIENVPMIFGFIPLTRHFMLTTYLEVITPRIIIYKRNGAKKTR